MDEYPSRTVAFARRGPAPGVRRSGIDFLERASEGVGEASGGARYPVLEVDVGESREDCRCSEDEEWRSGCPRWFFFFIQGVSCDDRWMTKQMRGTHLGRGRTGASLEDDDVPIVVLADAAVFEAELLRDEVHRPTLDRREGPRKGELVPERVVAEDEHARVDLERLRVVQVEIYVDIKSATGESELKRGRDGPGREEQSEEAEGELTILELMLVPTSLGGLEL